MEVTKSDIEPSSGSMPGPGEPPFLNLIDKKMDRAVAVAVMAALGHAIRLEVWSMLLPFGSVGLPAGIISARLAVPASSLSFHLSQMAQAKVLVQRRSSRQIIYAVNNEIVDALCDFLVNARTDRDSVLTNCRAKEQSTA